MNIVGNFTTVRIYDRWKWLNAQRDLLVRIVPDGIEDAL